MYTCLISICKLFPQFLHYLLVDAKADFAFPEMHAVELDGSLNQF